MYVRNTYVRLLYSVEYVHNAIVYSVACEKLMIIMV